MLTTSDILINAVSMGADITSPSQQLTNMFGYSVQASYSDSPTGVLKLQGSLDAVVWTDVADSSVSISTAGSKLWNIPDAQYEYVRVLYTYTSGSGILTAKFNGKGF